ncbi:MAG: TlpA family protein disulfide reductase [Lewinellaceae bacterium]|nr:TlpA family protein disulfide reductase [Lewinellaceae bacterium]
MVSYWSNANYMSQGRTSGSAINKGLESIYKRANAFDATSAALLNDEQSASMDAKAQADIQKRAENLGAEKKKFLDSLKTANTMLYRVATLYVHPDPMSDKKKTADYLQYVGQEYFRFADLKDKAYAELPDVHDAFQRFGEALLSLGANEEVATQLAEKQLMTIPADSKTYRFALGGICDGFKTNGPLYVTFGRKYVDAYRNNSLGEIGRLDYELKKSSVFTPGMLAPDLSGPTPDGGNYSMSELRGKVVLIDFWASWCGRCRREMPTVKTAYEKYKDKGFDILGVSLDREPEAWKKAIAADGIPWHHISDLKGWQSAHAALYSVNSIPATVLIDREGKIIARNLRGDQLEMKLKEVFGE